MVNTHQYLKMARAMLLLYMLRRQMNRRETSTDEETTDEGTSEEEFTDQRTSQEKLTDQGTSEKVLTDLGTSGKVLTHQSISEKVLTVQCTSGKVLTDQDTSGKVLTKEGTSAKELTEHGTSEDVNSEETLNIKQEDFQIKKEVCGENKCRVCLEGGHIPIYGEYTEDISEALINLCGIEVRKDDPFPKFICESCNTLLEAAILLRKTAQESDRKLKHPVEDMLVAGDDMVDFVGDDNSSDYELFKDKNSSNMGKHFLQSSDIKIGNQSYNTIKQPDNIRKESYNILEQSHNVKKHSYNIEEQSHTKLKKYYCMKCEISFNTFEDYTEHKSSQEHKNKRVNLIQKQSNNSYPTSYLTTDITVHSEDYLCDICGKKCLFQSDLVSHRKIHFLSISSHMTNG